MYEYKVKTYNTMEFAEMSMKLNYRIHTDAIKNHLIPSKLTQEQISYKYADEADMLNMFHIRNCMGCNICNCFCIVQEAAV